jgi:hypothetical protein
MIDMYWDLRVNKSMKCALRSVILPADCNARLHALHVAVILSRVEDFFNSSICVTQYEKSCLTK